MTAPNILVAICAIIAAYLIGSINFAVIFSSLFTGKDVRKSGSGNYTFLPGWRVTVNGNMQIIE